MDNHFDCLFNNGKYQLHYAIDKFGAAWFLSDELAVYLKYRPNNMFRMCAPSEVLHLTTNNPSSPEIGLDMSKLACSLSEQANYGGRRHFTLIRETGVYAIVMSAKSDRPEVEKFRHWVLYEVLPSLRQSGVYVSPEMATQFQQNPGYINDVIAQNQEFQRQMLLTPLYHNIDKSHYPYRDYEELKQFKQDNEEYIKLGQTVSNGDGNITFNTLAKILSNALSYDIGEHYIRSVLKFTGFLIKTRVNYNNPTDKAIKMGLLKTVYDPETDNYVTVVTPAGINFFIKFFTKAN